jgi:hypothetical protein
MNNLIVNIKCTSILKYIFYVQFTSATDFMLPMILMTEILIYLVVRVCFYVCVCDVKTP